MGLAPLGHIRPLWGPDGRRIGFGGRKEVFGDRPTKPGEDKSGNYPPSVFRANYAAARMTCRRYVWIYSHGPSWWRLSSEELARYGGPETSSLPLASDFADYVEALTEPKIIDLPVLRSIQQAVRSGRPVDALAGLGMPRFWWVVGPFPNVRGEGHDRAYPPESELNLSDQYEGITGPLRWHRVQTPPMGCVDLSRLIAGGVDIMGYGATCVHVTDPASVTIRFGCDDTGKIWVNGDLIHESKTERRAMPDEDILPICLQAGRSEILLKIGNYRGGWGFYFRITDAKGRELPELQWADDLG